MRNRKRKKYFIFVLLILLFVTACSENLDSDRTDQEVTGNMEIDELDINKEWDVYSTKFVTMDDWLFLSGISLEGLQYSPELTDTGLRIDLSNSFGWFRAHQQFLTEDAYIEVEVTQDKGSMPAIELYCRSNEPGEYRFFVYYGGFWDIGLFDYYTSEYVSLTTGMFDSLNPDGEKNIFTVTCIGDLLSLSVNDVLLGEALDSTYLSGIVGFGVQNVDPENTVLIIESFSVSSTNLDK